MAIFELMIALLLAILVLHHVGHKLGLPPAVALIIGGGFIALLPGLPEVHIDPELVLVIFLPPLLMDSAIGISLGHLRRHMLGVGALAIGAVLFTTVVVALVTHWLMPSLPWAACAALGALVAPPDAVSARAALQRVKLPRRLLILLEGESLFNDATGLVLFRFAVAAGVTGLFSPAEALGSFALLAVGGMLIGAVIACAWVILARRFDDDNLVIAAGPLCAWGSYLLAERFHVSGVIATVTTGLICAGFQHRVLSASARLHGMGFWTVTIFLLEAFVFLIIGSSLHELIRRGDGLGTMLAQMGVPVLIVVLSVILARFAWVYVSDGALILLRKFRVTRFHPLGLADATVLSWAGMRGVITLALAASLPDSFPGRDFILVTAIAVILATVLVQGQSLGAVIRWTGLTAPESDKPRLSMSEAEAAIARVQYELMAKLAYNEAGELVHPMLLDIHKHKAEDMARYARHADEYKPHLDARADTVLELIAAGRAELMRLYRAGDIDEHTLHELTRDLDLEELSAISAKA
ncbi:TPA: Na+/H+ antiporter [Burkholderia aenigmatica]|uniref:Na+/H+ antiporter n=1 Tax=Burkholderia sp. AU45251 TaxID=3059204 RepID=UPI00265139E7|nr:Na+/H+ antiporter [Burkholderia sp. AU45251]HDR9482928.1 Na+/H+ antiporter [Burkholderia aenigmatica]MDN7515793.1 Na+/H+ antiporter [Burkholderia sp. AU45251]HDR9488463.1 Na+/H+ antiporter [Burkholderia aenigmatica]HDR9513875.1 Na+/H+ antiporter [Burkholderia aenigmatica]HDR9520643.1 Na+/H+ antiporter [Burkholderia aenigmatica]